MLLYTHTGFSQSQLLRLVISIYGGVPEAFEVYHCRSTSTEEEIRLFMNPKRATKRPFQYLILEVNKLPYRLQEVRTVYSIRRVLQYHDSLNRDRLMECVYVGGGGGGSHSVTIFLVFPMTLYV